MARIAPDVDLLSVTVKPLAVAKNSINEMAHFLNREAEAKNISRNLMP